MPAAMKAMRIGGDALLAMLALGPLVWFLGTGALQLESAASSLRSLGRLAGVAGLAWLLLAMLLSIRVPHWDGPFGGLIRLWHIHHMLGAASFLLLLMHPILLALAAANSPAAVLATLTPPLSFWPIWAGWAALLLMMTFLAPSFAFFGEADYQRWKAVHLLSAGAVALGVAHAVPLSRALPAEQAIWLWGLLGGLALAAFLWRTLLSRVFSRRPYRITRVDALARGVVELSLAPEGRPMDYDPGQFAYLTPLDPRLGAGRGEEHPYSISSAPSEPLLRMAIKDLGDASGALLEVSVGSRVLIEGPYGQFLPRSHERPALWIGGGIGLTPFMSVARALADNGGPADVQLIYCAKDPTRAYFQDELRAIAAEVPGLSLHMHYFAEAGPLSLSYLETRVPDYRQRRAYICGPLALIALARQLLREAGMARAKITSEEFNLL